MGVDGYFLWIQHEVIKKSISKDWKNADPNATKIINQETYLITHGWTSSFLFVSQLSVRWWCPHHYFLPMFFLMFLRGHQIQKVISGIYKLSCPYVFWTTIFFSCLLFFFSFPFHNFHSIHHKTWGEKRGDSCRWDFGSRNTYHYSCCVSSFAIWGSKVLCEYEFHLWQAGGETTSAPKRRWAARDWSSQNPFANRNQKGCRKEPLLFLSSFRHLPYGMKWT